jgi:hypothetical protein
MGLSQLEQTIDRGGPESLQSRALEVFPDQEPYQTVVAYIRQCQLTGIFFFDEDWERCIYRSGSSFVNEHLQARKFDASAVYEYYKDKSERGHSGYMASDKDKDYYFQRSKVPIK